MMQHHVLWNLLIHRLEAGGCKLFPARYCSVLLCHDNQHYQLYTVNFSVPQGCVLGPQEFSACANELVGLVDGFHLGHYLYADDTQLLREHESMT